MILDIILFLAFTVFIGLKLFSVLGRKDFNDSINGADAQVLKFPVVADDVVKKQEVVDDDLELKHGAELAGQIKEIQKVDPTFAEVSFIQGVRVAFEMIVNAFAAGDLKTLKPLLDKEVYDGFAGAVKEREGADNVEDVTLVSILASNIKSIILHKKYAKIAVEIVSEQISLLKNKKGEVISGDPSQVDQVSELWTFARNLTSTNPNWKLVEIGSTR